MMRRREFLGSSLAAAAAPPAGRFVGVTVLPEYPQSEGVEAVLDNLVRRAGVTAVATSPYVMEPAPEGEGGREPPIDAGAGGVRLLDRPLWGKRELLVRTAPSFQPDERLYRGLRYRPAAATALTKREGGTVERFIRAARGRGLRVYLQVQAAIPPGYRVQFGGPAAEDRPRLPDGGERPRHVDNNGSLASPEIRGYTEALLRDLCRAYPEVQGYRVDWPEYPPYLLDDLFLDFGAPAEVAARRLGFDFEGMRRDAARLRRLLLGGLTERQLRQWSEAGEGLFTGFAGFPGTIELRRFRARLSSEMLRGFRAALDEAGGKGVELSANAFPPPLAAASGMDFAEAARWSGSIAVKLYTMHWPMMQRFYGDALRQANPGLPEKALVEALADWFDFADGPPPARLDVWRYPGPEEPHPAGPLAQTRKIKQAQTAAGSVPVIALAHGYGPVEDFRRRVATAYAAAGGRVWVNRYGYLSDRKLDAIGETAKR